MRDYHKAPAKVRVDLGDVAKVTKGNSAVGIADVNGGKRPLFEGLSID